MNANTPRSRRQRYLTTVAFAAACTPLAGAVPAALADDGPCTVEVTADTTLAADQPGCAVRVLAGGVTVDLGGHLVGQVDLSGVPAGGATVTVRHGTVDPSTLVSGIRVGVRVTGGSAELTGLTVQNADTGISVENAEVVITNDIVRTSNNGIALLGAHDSQVSQNSVSGNGGGIALSQTATVTVKGNIVSGNTFYGLRLSQATGTQVTLNTLTSNGAGIETAAGPNIGATVTANAVLGNTITGISLAGAVADSTVSLNTASGNGFSLTPGGAGIAVNVTPVAGHTSTVKISNNIAAGNAGLGIDAQGAVDGGGNHGALNGEPAQCVGVAC